MYILIAIVGLLASASAKDLIVGHEGGKIIFEQNVTANPAIWQQVRNLTVNASDSEVITRVVIVDNREDKNGEAAIVEGGEGHKNVTIELKSPAVFRGYDFEVQVYAKSEDGLQKPDIDQQNVQQPSVTFNDDSQAPKDDTVKGLPTLSVSTQGPNTQEHQHPVVAGKEDNQQPRPNRDTQEQKPVQPTSSEHNNQVAKKPDFVKQDTSEEDYYEDLSNDTVTDAVQKSHKEVTKPGQTIDTDKVLIDNVNDDVPKVVDEKKPVDIIPSTTTTKAVVVEEKQKPEKPQVNDEQKLKEQMKIPLPYVKQ